MADRKWNGHATFVVLELYDISHPRLVIVHPIDPMLYLHG